MAIGDLYELTFVQADSETLEPIITKWYYAAVDVLGNAQGLFEGWTKDNSLLERINNLQCQTVLNQSIRIINLFSLTDFYENTVEGEGLIASAESLPIHDVVNFTLKLDTRGVRPGSKRLSGIPESVQRQNLIRDGAYITDLNILANLMPDDVVEPLGAVFDPVVVKRIKYTVGEGEEAHDAYRLPANAGEANYGHINAALVNLKVSHQVSRGNGR